MSDAGYVVCSYTLRPYDKCNCNDCEIRNRQIEIFKLKRSQCRRKMNEYKEVPCKCGFTYEKNPDEFETYLMNIGSIMGVELPKKPIPRCKTCKTVSIIERVEE